MLWIMTFNRLENRRTLPLHSHILIAVLAILLPILLLFSLTHYLTMRSHLLAYRVELREQMEQHLTRALNSLSQEHEDIERADVEQFFEQVQDSEHAERVLRRQRVLTLILGALALVLAIITGTMLSGYISKPLAEDRNLLRTLIDNLPDHVYVKDIESRFVLSNAANLHFMGFPSHDELVGKTDFDLFKPEDAQKFYHDEQRVIDSELPLINQEGYHRDPETGQERWLLTTKVPFRDNQGRITGIVGINRDITDRKIAEEELKKHRDHLEKLVQKRTARLIAANEQLRELNASKDKFFSIISHDLRSPFTTILGYTRVIAEEGLEYFERDELKVLFDDLATSTENLYKLLENLLTWSRVQLGGMDFQPASIDIHEIVAWNVSLFASQANYKEVALSHAVPEHTYAYADQNMVDTVVRNLISNALKFTGAAGSIVVSSNMMNTYLEVAVSDSGVGIEQENIEHLFRIDTKYKTTGTAGEKGTGLGLILCKDFIEKNQGRIWVESEVGKGTTFAFTLPLPSYPAAETP